MKVVQLELISDYICPWCYLGKVRLEKISQKLANQIQLEFDIKPFILYPHIPLKGSLKSEFATKTKPGMGRSLRTEAKMEEIKFNYQKIKRIPSSFQAHRLTWLVKNSDQKYNLSKNIFNAYFENGQDIGDLEVLESIARQSVVDETIISTFKKLDNGQKEVERLVFQAKEEFISVVPSIRLNGKFLFPGLQSAEVWENYIKRAAKLS